MNKEESLDETKIGIMREEYYYPCSTCHNTECVFVGNADSHIKCKDYTLQEPILDKIRAEITAIAINGQVDEHTSFIRTGEQVKQMALNIIDKYKAEVEPQESEDKE